MDLLKEVMPTRAYPEEVTSQIVVWDATVGETS